MACGGGGCVVAPMILGPFPGNEKNEIFFQPHNNNNQQRDPKAHRNGPFISLSITHRPITGEINVVACLASSFLFVRCGPQFLCYACVIWTIYGKIVPPGPNTASVFYFTKPQVEDGTCDGLTA